MRLARLFPESYDATVFELLTLAQDTPKPVWQPGLLQDRRQLFQLALPQKALHKGL
jgi:hypothetical protein